MIWFSEIKEKRFNKFATFAGFASVFEWYRFVAERRPTDRLKLFMCVLAGFTQNGGLQWLLCVFVVVANGVDLVLWREKKNSPLLKREV